MVEDIDEFEVLLGNDEVSEDESEGDLSEINLEDPEFEDLSSEASDEILDELFED